MSKTIHSLQRQIEDAEHILDHLQHSRTGSKSKANSHGSFAYDHQVSESTKVIEFRQRKGALQEKVKSLRDIIVDNPVSYPSKEARIVCSFCVISTIFFAGCTDTRWEGANQHSRARKNVVG